LVECPIGNPICAFSIQLNLIIFQIVDGNMIISATRRGSEKPRATRALWIALRGVFEKRRRVLRQSASNKPGMGNVDETFQRMAASPQHKRVGPMKRLALIVVLVLVLAAPSVQAQTSPTNATTNSQLGNSNTANALGITTGVGNWRYDNWPATNKHKQPKLDDRRDLHRGNDRDILQCTERPEHEWLRIARRSRIERRNGIEWRVRRGRWHGIGFGRGGCIRRRRWYQHIVHSDLRGFSFGRRVVQLICNGSDYPYVTPSSPKVKCAGHRATQCCSVRLSTKRPS
jgi:hypothetical protein